MMRRYKVSRPWQAKLKTGFRMPPLFKWFGRLTFLCAIAFVTRSTLATTYYISFSTGSNSNNGTSESTPWRSHPYMQSVSACTGTGSAPSYTHHAGDQFIFMGGDSWPNACFPIIPTNGGSSGSVDYYGVNKSWWNTSVCGATNWCRPVFDAQNAFISPSNQIWANQTNGVGYVTLDNFEVRDLFWSGSSNTTAMSANAVALFSNDNGSSTDVTIENLYIHHWTHGTLAAGTGDALKIFWNYEGGGADGLAINDQTLNCDIDDSDGSTDSGDVFYNPGNVVSGNLVNDVPNGLVGTVYTFNGNIFENITQSFDDGGTPGCIICTHENGFEGWLDRPNRVQSVYDNVMHDTTANGFPWDFGPMFGGGTDTLYVYNNVTWNNDWGQPFVVDTNCTSGVTCSPSTSTWHLWNNTIYDAENAGCIRVVNRGAGNVGTLDIKNLHCINSSGTDVVFDGGISAGNYTHAPEVLETLAAANAQGYAISNSFRPTMSTNPTAGGGLNICVSISCAGALLSLTQDASGVWNMPGTTFGSGTDVSRPGSPSKWNIGAYQFTTTSSPVVAPTGLTAISH